MLVGIFSPVINWCGGAEWVAVNIINVLKQQGHQVIVLSDRSLNQNKFEYVFGRKVTVDQEIIFPLRFFSGADYHNIYTDALRSLVLKSKCSVLIDTFSNALLPGMNVSYIHHPLLRRVEMGLSNTKNKIYFLPYQCYLRSHEEDNRKKLIFANSKFTAAAVKAETGTEPYVLYPPVASNIGLKATDFVNQRDNNVTTVARIYNGKNLEIIPYIARLTRNEIFFTIVGLLDSEEFLASLQKLIKRLDVAKRVKILTNVKREQLQKILLNSKVYLHSAKNEHFGVSIVEAMSLGCMPVVHDSGGPTEFVPSRFRFKIVEEAAKKVEEAIDNWSPKQAREISQRTDRFNEKNFAKQFIDAFDSHFLEID